MPTSAPPPRRCGAALRPRAAGAEGGEDRRGDGARLALHLAVREAQDAMARQREPGVALAVALEGRASAVVRPPVRLDDEPLPGEQEVDLEARDAVVHSRARQAAVAAEREHALLEVAARQG